MKLTILLCTLIFSLTARAEAPGARKIEIHKTNGGGNFGFTYSSQPAPFTYIVFTVMGIDLTVKNKDEIVAPIYWSLIEKHTGQFLSDWANTDFGSFYVSPGSTQAFNLSLNGAKAETLAKHPRDYLIALAIKNGAHDLDLSVDAYIDLGDVCQANPDAFMNIETNKSGCP